MRLVREETDDGNMDSSKQKKLAGEDEIDRKN